MKVTFLGAAHEVTGSCTLLEVGDRKGLIDYGMEQGKDLFVNQPIPCAAANLDFVLLTHAHIDHSGLLPFLYKQGFRGLVYTSEATENLCEIMLRDCANIQESEAEWKNRKAKRSRADEVEPLYTMEDAEGILKQFRPCKYGEKIQLNDNMTIRLTDVGHLLGSAAIEIWLQEGEESRKICFSGDIGNADQPILRNPSHVPDADYLVMESTYGDRLHAEEKVDYIQELAVQIQKVLDRGGNMIIPSFAVGRTQEILYFIREIKLKEMVKGHGDFPVYVDSPLAIEATSVFLQCDTDYVDDKMQEMVKAGINPLVFPGLKIAVTQEESQAINADQTPKVIISASGMCDAGRVRHHLKHNLWRPESMVLFVGYQAVGTLGRLLVDGIEEVKLFNETIHVDAEIDTLPGISGHADKNGLLRWLDGFEKKPSLIFVNHGEPESAEAFTALLNSMPGYRAFAPYSGTCFDLKSNSFVTITEGVPIKTGGTEKKRKESPSFTNLIAAVEELMKVCRSLEGHANKELNSYTESIKKLIAKMLR
jgi:metallo-beta-lactamase family protein